MNFMPPNPAIAQAMIHSMQPHIECGVMLSVSVETILNDFENWFVAIGQNQKLAGFFCIRRPHNNFAEMGSVKSLQGVLPEMVQAFETQRKTEGRTFGCAITKNSPKKFAGLTHGKVLRTFPSWYQQEQSDKHFVQWQ